MLKRVLRNLKLSHIAAVDNPCQEGAKMAIMKRRDEPTLPDAATIDEVAKYICENDGAHSFSDVLRENKFSQEIWPCVDALSQSIRSIVGDSSITGVEREGKINTSVGEFLAAVRAISPEVAKLISPTIRTTRKETTMKTVEELQSEVDKLTGQLTSATTLAAAEKSRADTAETAKAAAETERDQAKAEAETAKTAGGDVAKLTTELASTKAALVAATDETIKFDETEVKKSEVGEASFKVTKGLVEKAELADLEKRAQTEFEHVPGTNTDKAKALRHIEKLAEDDPARKAAMVIFTAAEKMFKAGFDTLGTGGGLTETAKAAQDAFEVKVAEIEKRDNLPHSEAMSKARQDHPDLFEAYQSGGAAEAPAN